MSDFNYKDKEVPKLSDDFKTKFGVDIKGKKAIKLEGLTAFAHEKGIWKFITEIIQFPNDTNAWTAICKTTIGGYDWDPITGKVVQVEYSDIGDANTANCGKMVAASYIRMASTRSQARALRKYTNIDMVCSAELSDVIEEPPEAPISVEQLNTVKGIIQQKGIGKEAFGRILFGLFQHTDYTGLTEPQGTTLIRTLAAYIAPQEDTTQSQTQPSPQ